MANIVSYNNVIELFQSIAERHFQINTFFLGRNWELENNKDILYPLFQVYPELSKMPVGEYGQYKTNEITLTCKVIDLTTPGSENQRDVHSDTLRIANDIVNEINTHPFYTRSNINIIGDITFNPLEQFEDDIAAGWQWQLTLRIINMNTFCGMPIADLPGFSSTGPTSQGLIVNVQYLTCDDLVNCPTITTIDNTLINLQTQINNIPSSGLPSVLAVNNSTNNFDIFSPDSNSFLSVVNGYNKLGFDNGINQSIINMNINGTNITSTDYMLISAPNIDISGTTYITSTNGSNYLSVTDNEASLAFVISFGNKNLITASEINLNNNRYIQNSSFANTLKHNVLNRLIAPLNEVSVDATTPLGIVTLQQLQASIPGPQGLPSVLVADNTMPEGSAIASTNGTSFFRTNNDYIQLDITDINGNSINGFVATSTLGAQLHSVNGTINTIAAANTLTHTIINRFDSPVTELTQGTASKILRLNSSKQIVASLFDDTDITNLNTAVATFQPQIDTLNSDLYTETINRANGDASTLASANSYSDNLVTGLSWKKSVLYSTTTGENLTLTGLTAIIDGTSRTLLATDRILVKNQSTQTQNGLYNPNSGAWTHVVDANTNTSILSATVYVRDGSIEKNRVYAVNVTPITIGTTNITFALISGAGAYTYGAYLKLTGNVFDIDFTTFTTAQITDSTNKRFVTDVNLVVINNTSNINTGDNAVNSNYANDYRLANFVAGTNYLAPNGSAAALTLFPILNQNTTGSAGTLTTGRVISGTGEATFSTTAFDGSAPVSGVITLTNLAVISKVITGYVSGAGTILSTDSILQAIQKLNGNVSAIVSNVTHTGDASGATVLTLATVNANIGTFNNVTVNAKGLVTSASNVVYATGSGTATGTNTGNETLSSIATINHSATVKSVLVDADELTGQDSASTFSLFRTTLLNVWTYVSKKFETKTNGGDAAYSILANDNVIVTGTALTAPRIWTLPSAASVNAGNEKVISDSTSTITATNTITIAVQTGQYLNGVLNGTELMMSAGAHRRLFSDGVNNWFFDAGVVRLGATQTLTNKTLVTPVIGSITGVSGVNGLTVVTNNTASGAIARGNNLTPTLIASANNDVLVGLDINPTFTNGAFTGVQNIGLRLNGSARMVVAGGSSTVPSIAFNGDLTTGMAFGAGAVVLVVGGGTGLYVDTTGFRFNSGRNFADNATGNAWMSFTAGNITASDPNNNSFSFRNAPTAVSPILGVTGTDANIDFTISSKGAGKVLFNTTSVVASNATAANIKTVSGTRSVSLTSYAGDTNYLDATGAAFRIKTADNNSIEFWTNNIQRFYISPSNGSLNASFATSGAQPGFIFNNAPNTNQTASTEISSFVYNPLSRQWATGNITTQREFFVKQATYTAIGASTITNAYGGYFEAPIASTNVTITNNYALGLNGNLEVLGTSKFTATVTAVSALARAVVINPTLVASANNDVLVGLDINPTFTNGAFTGVTNLGARINGNASIMNPSANMTGIAQIGGVSGNIIVGNYNTGPNNYQSFWFNLTPTTISATNYMFQSDGNTRSLFNSGGYIAFRSSNVDKMQILANGNIIIQNGGTYTDAGYRLDVIGTGRFTSSVRMVSTTANDNNAVTNNKILKADTTGVTSTELTTDGAVGNVAVNRISVPLNSMMSVVLNISCKQQGSANSKQFLRQFRIINNAGTTTTGTITVLGTDDGDVSLATAAITVSANNTNSCLRIDVAGVAATNLRWTAFVVSTETIY